MSYWIISCSQTYTVSKTKVGKQNGNKTMYFDTNFMNRHQIRHINRNLHPWDIKPLSKPFLTLPLLQSFIPPFPLVTYNRLCGLNLTHMPVALSRILRTKHQSSVYILLIWNLRHPTNTMKANWVSKLGFWGK